MASEGRPFLRSLKERLLVLCRPRCPVLELASNLSASYGQVLVLDDISADVGCVDGCDCSGLARRVGFESVGSSLARTCGSLLAARDSACLSIGPDSRLSLRRPGRLLDIDVVDKAGDDARCVPVGRGAGSWNPVALRLRGDGMLSEGCDKAILCLGDVLMGSFPAVACVAGGCQW